VTVNFTNTKTTDKDISVYVPFYFCLCSILQEYQKSHMAISEWEKNIWGHFYNPVFKRD
jgi:hypothetical protein